MLVLVVVVVWVVVGTKGELYRFPTIAPLIALFYIDCALLDQRCTTVAWIGCWYW